MDRRLLELQGFARVPGRRVWTGLYYRRVFHGDEMVECFVLKALKLPGGEMLRPEFVSDRVTLIDAGRQYSIARLQRRVKVCKEQAALCSTAVFFEKKGDESDRTGKTSSSRVGGSNEEPERNCSRKR